jgi:transcriptional regulator with XRE-family HTH domain
MTETPAETLSQYVEQTMKAKGLTPKDVYLMSDRKITQSYVHSIKSGKAGSLSVEKVVSLAKGLGVDEVELFRVAAGLPAKTEAESDKGIKQIQRAFRLLAGVIDSPDIAEIMDLIIQLSRSDQQALLNNLRSYFETSQNS